MNNLGAGVRFRAAVQDTVSLAGEWNEGSLVRQRRFRTGILLFGVLSSGQPARLRKAYIDVIPPRADMRLHSLEHLLPVLVLVEAELEVGAKQPTALRDAVEQRMVDLARKRIGRAVVVRCRIVKERGHVA